MVCNLVFFFLFLLCFSRCRAFDLGIDRRFGKLVRSRDDNVGHQAQHEYFHALNISMMGEVKDVSNFSGERERERERNGTA